MGYMLQSSGTSTTTTYPLRISGLAGWGVILGLTAAAVLLPAGAHLSGLPVRWILPMHWPIIIAGLLYGWRGGLLTGGLAPISNHLLTGYPLLQKILPMSVELAIYGVLTGVLIARGWNRFAALALALVAGRMIFLLSIALTGAIDNLAYWSYVSAAMLPGLVAGSLQILLLGAWYGRLSIGSRA
ncbi:MAG: ECF transporter S component [Calditrichaeota bacterium]|nr:ECF transporter S component [Calditrichota bacterium]